MTEKTNELIKYNSQLWEMSHKNPENALRDALELESELNHLNLTEELGKLEITKTWCHIHMTRYEEAFKTALTAREIFKKTGNVPEQTRVMVAQGAILQSQGLYEESLEKYKKALENAERIHNLKFLQAIYINIGEIYRELKSFETALEYYKKALPISKQLGEKHLLSVVNQNLAAGYIELGLTKKAEPLLNEAIALQRKGHDEIYLSHSLLELGRLKRIYGDKKAARYYFNESMRISEKLKSPSRIIDALYFLAELDMESKLITASLGKCSRGLEIAKKHQLKMDMIRFMYLFEKLWIKKRNYKKALNFHQMADSLEKNLIDQKTKNKLAGMDAHYRIEAEKRKKEIYKLKNLELKKTNSDFHTLNIFGQKITATYDIEKITEIIHIYLQSLMPVSFFSLGIINQIERTLEYKSVFENGSRLNTGSMDLSDTGSVCVYCINNDTHFISGDIKKDFPAENGTPKYHADISEQINSVICVQLKIDGQQYGSMTVQSHARDAYSERHLDIVQTIASFSSVALNNAQTHAQLTNLNEQLTKEKKELQRANQVIDFMANHDALTQLPNRRLYFSEMDMSMERARRRREKLALIYIDLDNFKPVNDNFGHDAGDKVIQEIARRLGTLLRRCDFIARLGGDEFVALIEGPESIESIKTVAVKILESVAQPVKDGKNSHKVGASLGIALFPEDADNAKDLQDSADKAMYRAKRAGKGSYCFFRASEEVTDEGS